MTIRRSLTSLLAAAAVAAGALSVNALAPASAAAKPASASQCASAASQIRTSTEAIHFFGTRLATLTRLQHGTEQSLQRWYAQPASAQRDSAIADLQDERDTRMPKIKAEAFEWRESLKKLPAIVSRLSRRDCRGAAKSRIAREARAFWREVDDRAQAVASAGLGQ